MVARVETLTMIDLLFQHIMCSSKATYNFIVFCEVIAIHLQDPKVYVETILEVHHKYNALVLTAFNNDAGFVAALDKV